MLTPSLASFYSATHRGDWFGKPRTVNGKPNVHRGTDLNGWPTGTAIPSWCAGTVAATGFSTVLGNYAIVRRPDGLFAGYHHMSGVSVSRGDSVVTGSRIGYLGSTGTASTGPHLHATLARSAVVGGDDVIDPLPYIEKVIASAQQGGGTTPLPEENDMTEPAVISAIDDIRNKVSVAGAGYGAAQAGLNVSQAIEQRLYPIGADGKRLPWDYFQQLDGKLDLVTSVLDKVAGGQGVDVAAELKASEARMAAALDEQLQKFGTALMADVITSVASALQDAGDTSREELVDAAREGVERAFGEKFAPHPATS